MMPHKYVGGVVQTKSRTVPISHVAKAKTESPKRYLAGADWAPKGHTLKKATKNNHGIPSNPVPGRLY